MIKFMRSDKELLAVADFMACVKPEWWSVDSALAQLNGCLVLMQEDAEGNPLAWVSCRDLRGYRTLEVETMGRNCNGHMTIDAGLEPLLEASISWAREQGYANVRYTRSSSGLTCNGRALGSLSEELVNLEGSSEAKSFYWMKGLGFEPAGLLPDIYGQGVHGVILVYRL